MQKNETYRLKDTGESEKRWAGPLDTDQFAEEYGFQFEPGNVYLTQYPRMVFATPKYRHVVLPKKTPLLLCSVDVTVHKTWAGHIQWSYPRLILRFAPTGDMGCTVLEWDTDLQARGIISKRLQAWRATYQSLRPLEYHQRYQRFHAKRGS